jgi:undecaprenyl-diphosphatase
MVMDSRIFSRRAVALLVIAVFAFGAVAALVETGRTAGFDTAVREAVHSWSQPWLTTGVSWWTHLGDGVVLWPLGVLVAFWLVSSGRHPEAVRFGVAVVAANLTDEAIKWAIRRPRPQPWFGILAPSTYSFPSGHSFISCVFYLLLAASVIRPGWGPWRRSAVWGAAVLLTLSIGFSRVYLGVHYPTDVLAGDLAAIAWLTGVGLAGKTKRGPVARPPQ